MNSRPILQPRRNGFALVAVLLMVVLLAVVGLGMLSLSTISLRTSSRESAMRQARSNARLALQMAVGQLQELAGPDRRVTASSSIRAEGDLGQSNLTGVWEGWKWNGEGNVPDWKQEKANRFKGWLVSSPDPAATQAEEFVSTAAPGETVDLVAATADQRAVKVPVMPVAGDRTGESGKLAWASFDESQKTSINVPHETKAATFASQYDRMASAARPGYAAVTARDWKVLASRNTDVRKLVTTGQSALVGIPENSRGFHDITTGTRGLVANVADGGFAGDLSRLFDTEDLPSDFARRFLYSGTDTPKVDPPVRFSGANPMPSPDPSWALLQSYYRAYTKISGDTQPTIATAVTARPAAGTPSSQTLRHAAFNEVQIAPVIAKAQFVFSIGFGYSNGLQDMYANGTARSTPADQKDKYITWLVIDPVITLWNPYNVRLKFTGGRVDLHRIPLGFRLYKNGTLLNTEPTSFSNAYTVEDFKTREDRYYRLNILPESGKKELILDPGEHVVFTAHNHVKHYRHEYNLTGLTLRPGFHPPAGNDSDPQVGGVTTMNLFVDGNGKADGKDYGKTVRTVAVKAGDEIQVEVMPVRSDADGHSETGGKVTTGFLRYYAGGPNVTRLTGGIELDYGSREKELLPSFSKDELPTIVVNPAIPTSAAADDYQGILPPPAVRFKEPFLIATFQEKTERDSRFPSRSWLQNGAGNLYASAGIDQKEDFEHQQYEFRWEAMTDWPPNSPTIEISNDGNRGYGGSGVYAQTGTEFATFSSLPLAPAHSLVQLRHAPLNVGGQLPLTDQIVGNSFLPPLLGENQVTADASGRTYLDHSYLANNALFDSWFFSSAADHPALAGESARSVRSLLYGFFTRDQPLPNTRFQPWTGGEKADQLATRLAQPESYKEVAAHLLIDAPFNVNSTRVAAWQALLASNFGAAAPVSEEGTLKLHPGDGLPVLRHSHATAGDAGSGAGAVAADHAKWNGYRRLDEKQIARLAEEIVAEVKQRGPFQSVAEFVNRRPGSGELARNGALEAAIARSGINQTVLDTAHVLPGSPDANTADGAPGIINQADLLTPLAPQLVARGDTFRIRTYGEAVSGGVKARAWLEATVQRVPEFVDPSEAPTATAPSPVNQTFGRRFEPVSLRWLKPEEL
ncbi:hypothetical protein [Luteolibacter sp. LG18]|uniref:hypothetical protein n=1 Tax=Luteolibacter sp. LG18 TaxID=2819286 RepID=UPI002B31C877|nr:hypothetical protein llg_27990 [Luteolibacter sp. LG18]